MMRLVLITTLVLGAIAASGALASAEPAIAWMPEVVRWPVEPAQLDPTPGAAPAGSGDVTGAVTVTPDRAAVVWLGPATIDRVRVLRGDPSAMRLRRLTGSRGARLWLDEPGVRVTAGIQLVEPVGPGSLWVITAKQPLSIVVETMQSRPARLAWEIVRRDVARWIEHDGPLPVLPGDDDRALELRLLGARALVHALGEVPDTVAAALRLWRRLDAEDAIAVLRRSDEPYLERSDHVPAGASAVDEREVAFGAPTGPWQLTLEGPASLEIEACAERPAGGWIDDLGALEVRIDGSLAAVRREPVSPSVQPRGGTALPTDPAGERFGRRIQSELAIGPGSHAIEIRLDGLRWVRLAKIWRRPRLRDRDLTAAIARARARLAGERTPAARAAIRLLAGRTPAFVDPPSGLPAAVAAHVALATAPARLPDDVARIQLGRVTPLIGDPHIDRRLREALAFELIDRLPDAVAADPLAPVVVAWSDPPPALLAALAPRLERGLPADASSAADRAWRQAPTSARTHSAVIAAARTTRLLRLDPQFDRNDDAPIQTRWLTPGVTRPDEEPLGSLVEVPLTAGATATRLAGTLALAVAPSPTGGDRLAVLRVLAVTAPEQPGPIQVWLDGALHTTLGLQAVERVELAVAPGPHELRIEAPAGARTFIAAPGASSDHTGAIRIFHTASAGRGAPRYVLPTPRAGGPIRLEVHTRYGARSEPRTVTGWLYSDTGAPRRLVFEVSDVEREAWPLDGDAHLSQGASIWITLPPLTGRVWITTKDPDLLVHLAVPRGRAEAAPVYTGDEAPLADPLGEIEKRTLQLLANPDDATAAIARARALIELDETLAARHDLAAAATTATAAERAELALRIAQLDARVEHAYLPPQPPGGRAQPGVALTPLPPADADLSPAIAMIRSLRSGGSLAEPMTNAAVIWAQAALATRSARYHDAAALWAQLGSWQAEVAELVALTSSPYADPDRDAAVAYGLTSRLLDVELPALRRARAIAYRLSRWSSISNTTASAGYERLVLPDSALEPTPRGAVRRALVAAPWPDARILRPGHEMQFRVQGPAHVKLDVWCRRLWAKASTAGSCTASVQSDQNEARRVEVPHGEVTTLIDESIEAGRHVLAVSLGPDDPSALAALRLVETDATETAPRRRKLFLAAPGRPTEIVIAGPAALAVDVRGIGTTTGEARGARTATIELIGERSESTRVDLVAELVAGSAPPFVTAPVRHIVIVPEGTHRISVAPDRGRIAVRFARRVAARAIIVPGHPVSLPLLATTLPWPVSLDPPLAEAATAPRMRFVPSVELVVGQDTLDDLDGEGVLRGTRVELAAQARARLFDASWLGELRVRDTGDVQPTGRLRLLGDLDRLPQGIDLRVDVAGAVQMLPSTTAWRLDAAAQVERAVRLSPRLQLVPDLGLRAGSLGPELPPLDVDPWIASDYRRDHPIQWIARTGVWARPLADQFALARLEARSNADLVTLDQIRATLSWRALVELAPLRGPIAYLAYQPSYRFDDADRSTAYVRHDMTAELIWSFALPRGRLGFKLWADVYAPNAVTDSWQRSLGVALRWDDASKGEPIRFGFEEPLADYLDEVTWRTDR